MTRRVPLGRLLPALLALAVAIDVCGHILPTEWVAFRAWEVVTRYPLGEGHFTPNAHYVNDRAFGDLAAIANRPDWRSYHREEFTVDAFGFRQNAAAVSTASFNDVVIGDSFAAGSGLSDDETLSAQLEIATRRRVFNGGSLPIDLRHLEPLLDRLRLVNGVVFYEYLERDDLPSQRAVRTAAAVQSASVFKVLSLSAKAWEGLWRVCPLTIESQSLYKRFENRGVFPDTSSSRVVEERLSAGSRMLFVPSEVANFTRARVMDLSGVLTLQSALRARGVELRVVLVPEKYTVYAPLLARPPAEPAALYLDALEQRLHAADVPVVNLLPVFRRTAAADLVAGRSLYLADDTHWNAAGVRLAAETIRARWPSLNSQPAVF